MDAVCNAREDPKKANPYAAACRVNRHESRNGFVCNLLKIFSLFESNAPLL
jgi:hypothetical protein